MPPQAHAPFEAPPTFEAPTRFQRGVDPGDEGREVRHEDNLTIFFPTACAAEMDDLFTPGGHEDDI